MTMTAPATLATDDELQDLDLGASNVVALPTKSPEPKSATVADSKPLEGEIIPPTDADKKVAARATDNDAQFASIADRIRTRTHRGVLMLVENGRDLITVKKKMEHGRFGDWLKREFGWSERTAQNYMNASRAFDELAARGCAPESVALLPPTALYDFDRKSDEYKDKCVKGIMSGAIAKAAKCSKKMKPATSKRASTSASTDKNQDAAEELAKRIADALPHAARQEIDGHAGFNAPAFGGLLGKAIAASFGVRSSGGAE
ncbi:DUF3102 domain-containing protein [Mesorhizobium sp. LNHC221B00]|uniref:DUF3102 domain-containing protein n=1 Tax=Mesorhizobium sp. LNHC221B00 TaxID=1287233 RepID=UPI0018DD04CB|nr:DUF3102 domain-containing protein [Mesorhizobium sp. LNHC221B00]